MNTERDLARQGLSGDLEALRKLALTEENLPTVDDEFVARRRFWNYLAARCGCTSAAVRLGNRTFGLIRHRLSPKSEFRRDLDIIRLSDREKDDGLGDYVQYLKSVIDGDGREADALRNTLKGSGLDVLTPEEEGFLADRDNKALLPYGMGVEHIWSSESPPHGDMPELYFLIPSCVYVPWCNESAPLSSILPVDVEFSDSAGGDSVSRKQSMDAERAGRLLLVLRLGDMRRGVDVKKLRTGISAAILRVFNSYRIDVQSVCLGGREIAAKNAEEIAATVAQAWQEIP